MTARTSSPPSSPRAPASSAEGPGVASRWQPCSCEEREVARPSERTQAEREAERPRVKATRSVGCSEEASMEQPRWRWHAEKPPPKKTPFKSSLALQHTAGCRQCSASHRPSRGHIPQARGPSCLCEDFSSCHDCSWQVQTGKLNKPQQQHKNLSLTVTYLLQRHLGT